MPGRAAYMDGRSGASSMRLNFAGVPEQDIREGIRRIGRAISRQLGLLGLGLPAHPARPGGRRRRARRPAEPPVDARTRAELADVVELPRRGRTPSGDAAPQDR